MNNLMTLTLKIFLLLLLSLNSIYAKPVQSAATWVVSSLQYPDKNISQPQLEYTREFRHINVAEFWIDRVKNPQKLIANRTTIERFNERAFSLYQLVTPAKDFNTSYSSEWLIAKLDHLRKFLSKRAFYYENGSTLPKGYLQTLYHNYNQEQIPDTVTTQYAIITRYTNQRVTPNDTTLLKKPTQIYFDRNQNAALDIGTPIAILHQSRDKKWYLTLSPTSYGWVKADDLALATRDEMLSFANSREFIVTISPKNALYANCKYYDFVRMGVKLPYLGVSGTFVNTYLPTRDNGGHLKLQKATINSYDIHKGYLPYTATNITKLAFKFLNTPYGWGGMFGEQDCSKFIQEIYNCVGVTLPRNSGEQVTVAKPLIRFEGDHNQRVDALEKLAKPASTLLHLKGHIALYLGKYKNKHYMIHAVWGAIEGRNPVAKTVVTSVDFKNYLEYMDLAVSAK